MAKTVKAVPATVQVSTLGRKKLTAKEKQDRVNNGYYEPNVRFKRVAGMRARKVLNLLKGLRQCANTNVYEYNMKDVETMLGMIDKAVERVKLAYLQPTDGSKKIAPKAPKLVGIFG